MVISPAEYERQLELLLKALSRRSAAHVNTADEISQVRAVVTTWFETLRPGLAAQGIAGANLRRVDEPLRSCMELTTNRSLRRRYRALLRSATRKFKQSVIVEAATKTDELGMDPAAAQVAEKLARVASALSASYQQVHRDLRDSGRLSYRGTANELREALRELLDRLAPEDEVVKQRWFNVATSSGRPTHQQRARFVLEQRGAGSRILDVANESISIVEDGLARLVREMYNRTSAAAHTSQDAEEIRKMIRYFDALVVDLAG